MAVFLYNPGTLLRQTLPTFFQPPAAIAPSAQNVLLLKVSATADQFQSFQPNIQRAINGYFTTNFGKTPDFILFDNVYTVIQVGYSSPANPTFRGIVSAIRNVEPQLVDFPLGLSPSGSQANLSRAITQVAAVSPLPLSTRIDRPPVPIQSMRPSARPVKTPAKQPVIVPIISTVPSTTGPVPPPAASPTSTVIIPVVQTTPVTVVPTAPTPVTTAPTPAPTTVITTPTPTPTPVTIVPTAPIAIPTTIVTTTPTPAPTTVITTPTPTPSPVTVAPTVPTPVPTSIIAPPSTAVSPRLTEVPPTSFATSVVNIPTSAAPVSTSAVALTPVAAVPTVVAPAAEPPPTVTTGTVTGDDYVQLFERLHDAYLHKINESDLALAKRIPTAIFNLALKGMDAMEVYRTKLSDAKTGRFVELTDEQIQEFVLRDAFDEILNILLVNLLILYAPVPSESPLAKAVKCGTRQFWYGHYWTKPNIEEVLGGKPNSLIPVFSTFEDAKYAYDRIRPRGVPPGGCCFIPFLVPLAYPFLDITRYVPRTLRPNASVFLPHFLWEGMARWQILQQYPSRSDIYPRVLGLPIEKLTAMDAVPGVVVKNLFFDQIQNLSNQLKSYLTHYASDKSDLDPIIQQLDAMRDLANVAAKVSKSLATTLDPKQVPEVVILYQYPDPQNPPSPVANVDPQHLGVPCTRLPTSATLTETFPVTAIPLITSTSSIVTAPPSTPPQLVTEQPQVETEEEQAVLPAPITLEEEESVPSQPPLVPTISSDTFIGLFEQLHAEYLKRMSALPNLPAQRIKSAISQLAQEGREGMRLYSDTLLHPKSAQLRKIDNELFETIVEVNAIDTILNVLVVNLLILYAPVPVSTATAECGSRQFWYVQNLKEPSGKDPVSGKPKTLIPVFSSYDDAQNALRRTGLPSEEQLCCTIPFLVPPTYPFLDITAFLPVQLRQTTNASAFLPHFLWDGIARWKQSKGTLPKDVYPVIQEQLGSKNINFMEADTPRFKELFLEQIDKLHVLFDTLVPITFDIEDQAKWTPIIRELNAMKDFATSASTISKDLTLSLNPQQVPKTIIIKQWPNAENDRFPNPYLFVDPEHLGIPCLGMDVGTPTRLLTPEATTQQSAPVIIPVTTVVEQPLQTPSTQYITSSTFVGLLRSLHRAYLWKMVQQSMLPPKRIAAVRWLAAGGGQVMIPYSQILVNQTTGTFNVTDNVIQILLSTPNGFDTVLNVIALNILILYAPVPTSGADVVGSASSCGLRRLWFGNYEPSVNQQEIKGLVPEGIVLLFSSYQDALTAWQRSSKITPPPRIPNSCCFVPFLLPEHYPFLDITYFIPENERPTSNALVFLPHFLWSGMAQWVKIADYPNVNIYPDVTEYDVPNTGVMVPGDNPVTNAQFFLQIRILTQALEQFLVRNPTNQSQLLPVITELQNMLPFANLASQVSRDLAQALDPQQQTRIIGQWPFVSESELGFVQDLQVNDKHLGIVCTGEAAATPLVSNNNNT